MSQPPRRSQPAQPDGDKQAAATIRFDDIGNRLRVFRLGSGLIAEEVVRELGISRTALYRFEKGEITKIETLDKASEFLGVSVATLRARASRVAQKMVEDLWQDAHKGPDGAKLLRAMMREASEGAR